MMVHGQASPSGLDNGPTGQCKGQDVPLSFKSFLCDTGLSENLKGSSSVAPLMALKDLKSGFYPIFGQTHATASVQDRSSGWNVHTRLDLFYF